jgi:hypothetical protein
MPRPVVGDQHFSLTRFKREWIKIESTRCALVFYSSEQDASLGLNELEKTIHFPFQNPIHSS